MSKDNEDSISPIPTFTVSSRDYKNFSRFAAPRPAFIKALQFDALPYRN
jgi:hypothetical protein